MYDPEAVASAIARNVHALRTRRGWTLDALAQRSGVSKGMLVQIEQGRTNPSVATLCRVGNALGVAIPRLVEVAETPPVRIVKHGEAAVLWQGKGQSLATLLIGWDVPELTELWDWRIAPRDCYDGEAHTPGSRESLYVLDGTLTIRVGDVAHVVKKGDTILFRADRPHRYENNGRKPVHFVMVAAEPPAESAGEEGE